MLRAGLIAVLLLAAFPASAAKAPKPPVAWPTGLYSSVYMSKYTGDLGGMEIRFYEERGRRMAEFVLCEGWCNETYKVELTRGDNGFMFQTAEEMRFTLWREGKNLRISAYQGREKLDYEGRPWRLKPVAKTWGIAVAQNETKARANGKK